MQTESDWNCAADWSEKKWDQAYQIFLESGPLAIINKELRYHTTQNDWNDYGFTFKTKLPSLGYYEVDDTIFVDKRAILTVLARARKIAWNDWDQLSSPKGNRCPILSEGDALSINLTMSRLHG
jgi:hypothetical protein